ncbi:MAG: fructokinase [Actinomycetota bacterium]|nr:fructokinase [Actinomycetota bacterium]
MIRPVSSILVIGEALVDIVRRTDGSRAEHPGGSPANVALGLARLERDATLLTRIGRDERGRTVRRHLEGAGVRLLDGSITAEPTSTATARLDAAGVATYEFDLDWRLPTALDPAGLARDFQALHTGSIAAFLQPGGDDVLRALEAVRGTMTISYDPNARPALMGEASQARARVERIVALSDLVKVSDEDLAWLAPGEDPLDVAREWAARGPAVVVVTLGGQGAVGLCAAGRVRVPAPATTLVDTVGAGDSFMSGLLDHVAGADLLGADRAERLRGIDERFLRDMLEHAARLASITCGREGADPPTRAELS